jgi:hypothetical protein
MRAYLATNGDGEAARKLGDIQYVAFRHWRLSRGLPGKEARRSVSEEEFLRRLKVLGASKSLDEAAKKLGLSVAALRSWQRAHDKSARLPESKEDRARRRMYMNGATDQDVAEEFGISIEGAKGWRHLHMREHTFDITLPAEENARRREAYDATANDQEAAAVLGLRPSTYTSWRISQQLATRTTKVWNSEVLRRVDAYLAASTDEEAANLFNARILEAWESFEDSIEACERLHLTPRETKAMLALDKKLAKAHGPAADRIRYEMAGEVGLRAPTFTRWRLACGLPPKSELQRQDKSFLRAYVQTWGDEAAADRMAVPPAVFTAWRSSHHLPERHPVLKKIYTLPRLALKVRA